MRATVIQSGQKFKRWTVLREVAARNGRRLFECRCDCGVVKIVRLGTLKVGDSGSCGCLMREIVTTHGQSRGERQTPEWRAWCCMRTRCGPHYKNHKNYGGRGIKVCKRWDESFEAFLSDMGPKPPRTSLDRIDNDGNYEPGNCRWTTQVRQTRNTRRNVWVWYKGQRSLLADVADAVGIPVSVAYERRKRGWPDDRLFDPVAYRTPRKARPTWTWSGAGWPRLGPTSRTGE